MNVFDIIGPVMVGPSSSHTAGAVRFGVVARNLLGDEPAEIVVKFHGSFAQTYRGHGTDKAIVAGFMGFEPDDVRIRDSLSLAGEAGIRYRFETAVIKDAHPNTAYIMASGKSGKKITLQVESVGGGSILVKKFNDMDVEFTGQYNTLIISQGDTPGIIASITDILGKNGVNIANMRVFRPFRGSNAVAVIETDQEVPAESVRMIRNHPEITDISVIKPF